MSQINPNIINGLLNNYQKQYKTSHSTVTELIRKQFEAIEIDYERQLAERHRSLKTKQEHTLETLRKQLEA